eukprot:6176827-Pleurochrysis_carterae.AAC.4
MSFVLLMLFSKLFWRVATAQERVQLFAQNIKAAVVAHDPRRKDFRDGGEGFETLSCAAH